MDIQSIRVTLPCCQRQEEQTQNSLILRVLAVAIGVFALIVAVLMVARVPVLCDAGPLPLGLLMGLGALFLLAGVCIRCVQKALPSYRSSADIRDDRPICTSTIFHYFEGLADHHPELKIPECGAYAQINEQDNTLLYTVQRLLDNPNNVGASAFAFNLHLSGPGWKHHTLVYIDCIKRTVEFYDNVVHSDNHPKVVAALTDAAKLLSERLPGNRPFTVMCKITQPVLGKPHDCGAWVMYFAEHRFQNPDVDFNHITPAEGKKIMRQYRDQVSQILMERERISNEKWEKRRSLMNPR